MTDTTPRHAIVRDAHARIETIRRYLPSNFTADSDGRDVFIHGVDSRGWTLDGYVIPRLASGMIRAEEICGCDPDAPRDYSGNGHDVVCDEYDGAPCCADPGCGGSPCTFPGYADNH
jgi:hypothetical protein